MQPAPETRAGDTHHLELFTVVSHHGRAVTRKSRFQKLANSEQPRLSGVLLLGGAPAAHAPSGLSHCCRPSVRSKHSPRWRESGMGVTCAWAQQASF